MDYGALFGYLLFLVPVLFAIFFVWRSSKRQNVCLQATLANTKAVEENTAVTRELIAKMGERKP